MSRSIKTLVSLSIITALLFVLSIPAFAGVTETIKIKTDAEFGGEEKFEITNVASTDKNDKITVTEYLDGEIYKTYDARDLNSQVKSKVPTVITSLQDQSYFDVYKLEGIGDKYSFSENSAIPFSSGKIKYHDLYGEDRSTYTADISKMAEIEKKDGYIIEKLAGTTVKITEPGYYFVMFGPDCTPDCIGVFVEVEGTTATPTSSKVTVDGTSVSFDAYNIDGNNYFKLRDLAKVLNGTKKQFEVAWDGSKNAINLTSGKAYTSVGGELATGSVKSAIATSTTSSIYIDGKQATLTAYNINGNNYFKLRDIGKAFNFGVAWDGASNTISINTANAYSE